MCKSGGWQNSQASEVKNNMNTTIKTSNKLNVIFLFPEISCKFRVPLKEECPMLWTSQTSPLGETETVGREGAALLITRLQVRSTPRFDGSSR